MKRVSMLLLLLAGCSAFPKTVVSTGPDTYLIEHSTGSTSVSAAELTLEIFRQANAFCAEQKKQPVMVKFAEHKHNWFPFPNVYYVAYEFRCVAQGDPAAVAK